MCGGIEEGRGEKTGKKRSKRVNGEGEMKERLRDWL